VCAGGCAAGAACAAGGACAAGDCAWAGGICAADCATGAPAGTPGRGAVAAGEAGAMNEPVEGVCDGGGDGRAGGTDCASTLTASSGGAGGLETAAEPGADVTAR